MEQSAITKPVTRTQSSIRSFFQPRQPNYTPPPNSANSNVNGGDKISPTPTSPHTPPKLQVVPQSSPPASKSPLPPQASISPVHEKHIQPLKRINALLLPINYPDIFYQTIIDPQTLPNFSRVILWEDPPSFKSVFSSNPNPKVVGGIVCRLDRDEKTKSSSIYIQSLALLSPYRSHGLATAVLDDIINGLVKTPLTEFPVTSLYAHVWTENAEGLEWYTARGFTREEPVVQGYYRRLQPGNAWIMRRPLVPSDHLRHSHTPADPAAPNNGTTTPPPPPLPTSTSTPPITTPSTAPTLNLTAVTRAASYQTTGPGHEWNDLPDDILTGASTSKPQTPDPFARGPPGSHLTPNDTGSAASSRSSSSTRNGGKKKRQYPAAAFSGAVNGATGSS
jgi:N-alpha-acetyltransferase 50